MDKFEIEKIDKNNREFENALNIITNTSQSLFLTGKAGTGKSTFLKYLCSTTKKKYVILAPTGVAAVNVGGVTIHSFFNMPFRPMLPDDEDLTSKKIRDFLKYGKEKIQLIEKTELFIIDEISMVRADTIDFIDKVLRKFSRNKNLPFGGKQLLFVGDVFQLEPVIKSDEKQIFAHFYPNNFFFSAKVFNDFCLVTIELLKTYRQKDPKFIEILDKIRTNNVDESVLSLINSRHVNVDEDVVSDYTITLATKRDLVDTLNQNKLNKINNQKFIYYGIIEGEFPSNSLPTPKELELKEGAQVMFIKNDVDKRWYNGSIGIVSRINENKSLFIVLENGEEYEVEPEIWDNVRYKYNETKHRIEEEVLGTYKQLPVRLAWAMTIHKCQGLTFEKVIIDLSGGVFAGGQTYVALSRCKSLEGIILRKPVSRRDIFVNNDIIKFSRTFNNQQVIDNAMKQSYADRLYADADYYFRKRNFSEMLESLIKAMHSRYDLEKPAIKKLITRKLLVIKKLEDENKILRQREAEKEEKLKELAGEFLLMGNECIVKLKNYNAAIANYNKALILTPNNVEVLVRKGVTLHDSCDYIAAEECFNKAIELSPLNFKARYNRGKNRMKLKNEEGALSDLEKATSIKPEHKMTHELLYELYIQKGDHIQAMIHHKLANPDKEDL